MQGRLQRRNGFAAAAAAAANGAFREEIGTTWSREEGEGTLIICDAWRESPETRREFYGGEAFPTPAAASCAAAKDT